MILLILIKYLRENTETNKEFELMNGLSKFKEIMLKDSPVVVVFLRVKRGLFQ